MDSFTIKKKVTKTEHVSIFIRNPDENDGSGWSYTANSDGEYLLIDWAGRIRLAQLPVLVNLLEYVIVHDTERNTNNEDAHFTGTTFLDSEAELEEVVRDYAQPVHGSPAHDTFTASAAHIDLPSKRLMSVTVNRINHNYYVYVGGAESLYFHSWEVEGIIALAKEFIL